MAKRKTNRGPAAKAPANSNARRLGGPENRPAPSAGAQRRNQRATKRRSNTPAWIAIGAVVVIVAVFLVWGLSGSSTPSSESTSSGASSGQSPVLASVSQMVDPVATIPLSVYDSVGVAGLPATLTKTKGQTYLKLDGLPRFVYEGAEYCPYCAQARWAMVAALSRFGTFSKLKMTSSANTDSDIVTFSFLGSTYKSKYVSFTPYETLDRNQNPLQPLPSDMASLYLKYDGNASTGVAATPFNQGSPGIPFVDFANQYVSSGWLNAFAPVLNGLAGGGPDATQAASAAAIAAALHDPTSAVGTAISANLIVGMANYYSGAICETDGQIPASVCGTSGVKAAEKNLTALTAVG